MKFAVDRIENDIVICENLETKEKVSLSKNILPKVRDGSILIYEKGKYVLDANSENERRKSIRDRFNRLKKN